MYKAIQNNKYYLSMEVFPLKRKSVSNVYLTGIRIWESFEAKNYSLVIYRARVIFAVKKPDCKHQINFKCR